MLKKAFLVSLFFSILFLSSFCFAESAASADNAASSPHNKVIGIFLDLPVAADNNEEILHLISERTASLFPPNRFILISPKTTEASIRTQSFATHASLYSHRSPTEEAIQQAAKGLNCDYAVWIAIYQGLPTMSADFTSATYRTSISCTIRLLQVQTGAVLSTKQITRETVSAAYRNGSQPDQGVYYDALEQALTELKVDAITRL